VVLQAGDDNFQLVEESEFCSRGASVIEALDLEPKRDYPQAVR